MERLVSHIPEPMDDCFIADLTDRLLPELRATVVPIFLIRPSTPTFPVQVGSGTLFRVADMSFLVTAAHVFRTTETEDSSGLYTYDIGQGVKFIPLNGQFHIDDEHDIALLALSERQVQSMSGREFLSIHSADRTLRQSEEGWYILHGYPSCWTIVKEEEQSARCRPYTRIARLFSGSTTSFEKYNEQRHVLLDHSQTKTVAPTSLLEDTPKQVHGISGCSIWRIFRDGESADSWRADGACIVAVETGVYKGGRVVKGTRWAFVYRILYECFPELRRPLDIVIPEKAPPNGNLDGLERYSIE